MVKCLQCCLCGDCVEVVISSRHLRGLGPRNLHKAFVSSQFSILTTHTILLMITSLLLFLSGVTIVTRDLGMLLVGFLARGRGGISTPLSFLYLSRDNFGFCNMSCGLSCCTGPLRISDEIHCAPLTIQ